MPSSSLAVNGFHVLRQQSVRKHEGYLYVANSLSFVQVDIDILNVAGVVSSDLDVYILAVYRFPSYSPAQDENLLSFLGDFYIGKEVVILGDFNVPSLD